MKRRVICLAVWLLGAAAGAATGSLDTLRQANEALSRGDAARALALLDQALRQDPGDSQALLFLGRTYLALGRPAEAAPALRRAADALSGEARLDALSALAVALSRAERTAEAAQILEEMTKAAPARLGVHQDLGLIDLSQGRLASARDHFQKELDLIAAARTADPAAGAQAREGLGVAACRMGDDAAALAAFEAVRSQKGAALTDDGLYHYGLTLQRAGRNEEAAAAFRDILTRQPEHRGALQNLARAAGALGLTPERDAALAQFSDLYRRDEEQRARRVKVADLRAAARQHDAAHDPAGAAASLKAAVDLDPDDPGLRIDYGRALHKAGQSAQAMEVFTAALARDPLQSEAHYRLGKVQIDAGDLESGLASLERAAQLQPLNVPYHVSLAQTYLRLQRNDDGVRELRLAQRLAPDDPESAFNLGLGLAQAGSLQEAAGQLELALARGYKDPVIHSVLSQVYQAMGDAPRSASEMETYRRLTQPQSPPP